MIRGVDRKIRKAIKDAAKAEGVSVGTWVRRSLVQALNASVDGPPSTSGLNEHMRMLGARLSVLEKSHRALRRKVQVADKKTTRSASVKRTR
jgi:hypothetical protein